MGIESKLVPIVRTLLEPFYTLRLVKTIPEEERDNLSSTAGVSYDSAIAASIFLETAKFSAYIVLVSDLYQKFR